MWWKIGYKTDKLQGTVSGFTFLWPEFDILMRFLEDRSFSLAGSLADFSLPQPRLPIFSAFRLNLSMSGLKFSQFSLGFHGISFSLDPPHYFFSEVSFYLVILPTVVTQFLHVPPNLRLFFFYSLVIVSCDWHLSTFKPINHKISLCVCVYIYMEGWW